MKDAHMPDRLAEYLVRLGHLDAALVERAIDRQLIEGGALDTALLELGLIDETTLVAALAAAYEVEIAKKEQLLAPPDSATIRTFPEPWAAKHGLAPLDFDRAARVLRVLSPAPADVERVSRLGELLDLEMRPVIAPECRVQQRIALAYERPLPDRFHALVEKLDKIEGGTHRVAPARTSSTVRLETTLAALGKRLEDANERDDILALALDCAAECAEFAALFRVMPKSIVCISAHGPGSERTHDVELDTTVDSAFRVVLSSGGHYLGPLFADGVHRHFLDHVGRTLPKAALIVPIRIRDRTVVLLYADNGSRAISPRRVDELVRFASRVRDKLESLLVRRKAETLSAIGPSDDAVDAIPIDVDESVAEMVALPAPLAAIALEKKVILGERAGEGGVREVESATWEHAELNLWDSDNVTAADASGLAPENPVLLSEEHRRDMSEEFGDDVRDHHEVALERTTGDLVPVREPTPLVPAPSGTSIDALLDGVTDPDAKTRGDAQRKLLAIGSSVLPRLMERFPGYVAFDPFVASSLPSLRECSELLALLLVFGADAHPHVLRKIDAANRSERLFATYFYEAVRVPEAIPRLIQRLHDEESRICMLAARTLFAYRELPEFGAVVTHVHNRLAASSVTARRHAAHLASLFCDVSAIPMLIDILERKENALFAAAEGALRNITKQEFGTHARKWAAWWAKHGSESRVAWLVDGLDAKDETLRRSAFDELRAITGLDMGFDPRAPKRQRDRARENWRAWSREHVKRAETAGSAVKP